MLCAKKSPQSLVKTDYLNASIKANKRNAVRNHILSSDFDDGASELIANVEIGRNFQVVQICLCNLALGGPPNQQADLRSCSLNQENGTANPVGWNQ